MLFQVCFHQQQIACSEPSFTGRDTKIAEEPIIKADQLCKTGTLQHHSSFSFRMPRLARNLFSALRAKVALAPLFPHNSTGLTLSSRAR